MILIVFILAMFVSAEEKQVVFKYPGKLDKIVNQSTNEVRYRYGNEIKFKYPNNVEKTSYDTGKTWEIKTERKKELLNLKFFNDNEKIYFEQNIKNITFYNLLGIEVLNYNFQSMEYIISQLTTGLYVVRLESEYGFKSIKFIKN
jgi:hypothetical protein